MIDREKPIWQAYDEATNAPSGRLISMREAGEGVLHGAVHVVLWRPDSESPQDGEPQILLQQRSDKVRTWRNRWEMTSTGHIDGSETEVEAAVRELKEETGLTLAEEDLTELARVRPDTHPIRVSDDIEENEVLVLFGAKAPEGWSPSVKDGDGEADNFRWVPVSSYLKMVNRTVNELVQNGGRVGDADLTNIDMQITPHGTNYADELARAATYSAVFHDINQADRANYPDAYNW